MTLLPVHGFQKSCYLFRAPPEAFAREKGLLVSAAQTKPTEAFLRGECGGGGLGLFNGIGTPSHQRVGVSL